MVCSFLECLPSCSSFSFDLGQQPFLSTLLLLLRPPEVPVTRCFRLSFVGLPSWKKNLPYFKQVEPPRSHHHRLNTRKSVVKRIGPIGAPCVDWLKSFGLPINPHFGVSVEDLTLCCDSWTAFKVFFLLSSSSLSSSSFLRFPSSFFFFFFHILLLSFFVLKKRTKKALLFP